MIIDLLFSICLILGFYHGYQKGVLYSAVSIFGVFIASLAAMKLTYVASVYLTQWFEIPQIILPFVSMLIIFLTVFLSLKLLAYILVRFLETIQLNSINKIAGGALWGMLGLFLLSTFVWLMDKGHIIKPELKAASFTFSLLHPMAQMGFDVISYIVPIFKEWYLSFGMLFEKVGR
jgi:membrane protein required for colicin V production